MMTNRAKEKDAVWTADLGNGTYQNPIIHADLSDPDVIHVGEDFFMVASSFNMSPCLPLLHSRDLVNWTIVNHISKTFPDLSYDRPRHGDGVWAPSIRYHDGKYWVFFGAPDEGIYMSTAENPFGTWSELRLIKEVKGWIDPCPFWDDDGQAYLVHAFARSRIGFKHILQICKMKPDGTALLDDGKYIYDGTTKHPTIEGPKMYKRNGYYYIFAPAGGVATGWQTVLRSTSIYGPYVDKVVLAQGSTTINGPHQGGWIELDSGESWFVHFQDKGAYGRITHLQPMRWEDDWPVMGTNVDENGVGEPVMQWKKPNVIANNQDIMVPQTTDLFDGKSLGLQWQWRANMNRKWYDLGNNRLRLFAIRDPENDANLYDRPQIIAQKFPAPEFTATTKVELKTENEQDCCGLTVMGRSYGALKVRKTGERIGIFLIKGENDDEGTVEVETKIGQMEVQPCFLRVEVIENAVCQFSYSTDGLEYIHVGSPFHATAGKWVGSQVGIFCIHEGRSLSKGYADFHLFEMEQVKKKVRGKKR